jgi:hypothetical protein
MASTTKKGYSLIKWIIAVALLFFWIDVIWVSVSLHSWLYICVVVIAINIGVYLVKRTHQ